MESSVASARQLLQDHERLTTEVRDLQRRHRNVMSQMKTPPQSLLSLPMLPPAPRTPPRSPGYRQVRKPPPPAQVKDDVQLELPPDKLKKAAIYPNYVPEEETIRNDYSQRYVDSGDWPQNWVLGADPEKRFEEYPKQRKLLELKKAAVAQSAVPPMHLPQSELASLVPSAKFDVILIDPPFSSSFSWDTLESLPVPALGADPSFVFLWVGSGAGEGLERGRAVIAKWGYRRCEDVVWIKTNRDSNNGPGTDPPTTSLLTRTKQHCLMGIRGTVRRSTDNWFVHCNVDTDVIIWEGDPTDPTRKPPEMYTLIENFCLGLRKLEIFGRAYSLRDGWVTVGDFELSSDIVKDTGARPWDFEAWNGELVRDNMGRAIVPMTQEIEILRPKSPNRSGHSHSLSNVSSGSFGTPAPAHVLPNRPTGGRNTSGGLGGGVGLGIVNRPQPQPSMTGNPPLGIGMPNMQANPMNMGIMTAQQPMMIGQHMQPNMGQPMHQQPMGIPNMMGVPMMGVPMHFQPQMGMPIGMGMPMGGGFGGDIMYPMGGMPMMPDANAMGMIYNGNPSALGGMPGAGMNMMGGGPMMNMNMMNDGSSGDNSTGTNPNQRWNGGNWNGM